jgi:hypothetical protein
MMNVRLAGQISYNSSLSNTSQLKLAHYVRLFLVEMQAATGKDIAEHVFRPVNVITASLVPVIDATLLISILRLGKEPKKMKVWWMRRKMGNRLIVVIM